MFRYVLLPGIFKLLVLLALAWVFVQLNGCASAPTQATSTRAYLLQDLPWEEAALVKTYLDELNPNRDVYLKYYAIKEPKRWATACLNCTPCYIEMFKGIPKDTLRSVIWHEYGHCVGFDHEKRGIMYKFALPFHKYSSKDILNFMLRVRQVQE